MEERIRCFLAFALPDELTSRLAKVQRKVRGSWPEGSVRWVAVDNLHLTLRFFGDLDREQIDRVVDVLKTDGTRWVPVPVTLSRVSAFPTVSRPRVVWVGLSAARSNGRTTHGWRSFVTYRGGDRRAFAEGGVSAPGQAVEEPRDVGTRGTRTSFRPPRGWERVEEPSGAEAGDGVTEFTLRSLVLMKSELKPRGAVYTPVYEVRA